MSGSTKWWITDNSPKWSKPSGATTETTSASPTETVSWSWVVWMVAENGVDKSFKIYHVFVGLLIPGCLLLATNKVKSTYLTRMANTSDRSSSEDSTISSVANVLPHLGSNLQEFSGLGRLICSRGRGLLHLLLPMSRAGLFLWGMTKMMILMPLILPWYWRRYLGIRLGLSWRLLEAHLSLKKKEELSNSLMIKETILEIWKYQIMKLSLISHGMVVDLE